MRSGEVAEVNTRVCFNFSGHEIHSILSITAFSVFILGQTVMHLNLSISERGRNTQITKHGKNHTTYPPNCDGFSLLRELSHC